MMQVGCDTEQCPEVNFRQNDGSMVEKGWSKYDDVGGRQLYACPHDARRLAALAPCEEKTDA